jgi:hypothetical protein
MAKKSLQWWINFYTKKYPENSKATIKFFAERSFNLQPGGTGVPKNVVSPNAGPIIGKNPAPPILNTTPKPTLPGTPNPVPSNLEGAIGGKLKNVNLDGVKVDNSVKAQDWVQSLSNKEMNQILPILKKLGASKTNIADYDSAKNFLLTTYPTYIDNSGFNVSKLVKLFNDNLTGYGADSSSGAASGTKSNGVTQYVTKQDKALVAKDVDKFLLSTIGSKNINQASRDKIMAEINKMIEAGTTTTSKMDKKTGKTTVVQTPGYSEERLGEVVSRVAKQGEPEKYEQQRQLNFFDFMQQAEQMRGGR